MKYKVTISTLIHEGKRYKRGDIIETDIDYGTRVEAYSEPPAPPKRKRRTKAEIEADALVDVPKFGDEDVA